MGAAISEKSLMQKNPFAKNRNSGLLQSAEAIRIAVLKSWLVKLTGYAPQILQRVSILLVFSGKFIRYAILGQSLPERVAHP